MKNIPNYRKSEFLERNYNDWKTYSFQNEGFFPIFQSFKEGFYLNKLSGNAVKLYLYLGLMSGNDTGKTWVTIDTMSKYFGKSKRTISEWLKELETYKLIDRMQMEPNGVAYTFLLPYTNGNDLERGI